MSNIRVTTANRVQIDNQLVEMDKDGKLSSLKTISPVNYVNFVQQDKPFSTSSAACAYDQKHERLYYTPMGINQLRYIDLKSGNIYYFEDEPFGALGSARDVPNQITRMVMGSDGNGYALTNNGNHLIQFTTGKKPMITDLGALTDDISNAGNSVHNSAVYGGDMIADAHKNLYLITANRFVFKISLENKLALYQGVIKGLPKNFSTNGAIAEGGSMVIVSSSNSTEGYFRFDLNNLQAEKIETAGTVYNASDLANGILAFDKKKKDRKHIDEEPLAPVVKDEILAKEEIKKPSQEILQNTISIYPNPVTTGVVKLSFSNQPEGKYQVQFMDISGKIISAQEIYIGSKLQVEEFRLPKMTAAGNYLMKIFSEANKVSIVNQLVIQ